MRLTSGSGGEREGDRRRGEGGKGGERRGREGKVERERVERGIGHTH